MIYGLIAGFAIYGYGYVAGGTILPLAVTRTAYSVICMFLGRNDYSAISSAPHMKDSWLVFLFWITHIAAFYSMANAVFSTIGGEALRKFRQFLNRKGNKVLIYGDSKEAVKLAKDFSKKKDISVILIDMPPVK